MIRGSGERDVVAAGMPREQHAGLFEQFARRGDVIRERLCRRQAVELRDGVLDAVAPRGVGVAVGGVDAAAGKHVRTAHERRALMAADHEDFRPGRTVAQHHDRSGGTRICNDRRGTEAQHLVEDTNISMDKNGQIAALLRDFAAVQKSQQSMWGYKRAASAILALEQPIETLLKPDGTLQKIRQHRPLVDPHHPRGAADRHRRRPSSRPSPKAAAKADDVERRRGLRNHFLSRAQVLAALRNTTLTGPRRRGLPRRSPDALDLERRQPDAGRHHRDRHQPRLRLLRGDRSFVRPEDRRRRLDGGARRAAHGDRRAQQEISAADSGCSRASRRTSAPTARWTWSRTSSRCSRSSSPRRTRCCARRTIRPTRMVTAVSQPGVHILGHPRGRMFGSRPGVSANWDRVFEAAARSQVAIEIDGDPSRQDLDYDIAQARGRRRLPVRARQRRALDARAARLRRDRDRARPARRRPGRSHRQLLDAGAPAGVGASRRLSLHYEQPHRDRRAGLQACPSHNDRPVISR